MTNLLRAAEHLQIIGLTQTRRSPVNFGPTVLRTTTTTPTESPLPLSSSSSVCGESQPQGYSKKSRILEQNKVNTAIVSSSSAGNAVAAATNNNNVNPSSQAQARDFRTESSSRDMMGLERDPLGEQHSPLVRRPQAHLGFVCLWFPSFINNLFSFLYIYSR